MTITTLKPCNNDENNANLIPIASLKWTKHGNVANAPFFVFQQKEIKYNLLLPYSQYITYDKFSNRNYGKESFNLISSHFIALSVLSRQIDI